MNYSIYEYLQELRAGIVNGSSLNLVSFGKPSAGAWHYLVFTWDGNYLRSYVDGSRHDIVPQTENVITSNLPVYIGRSASWYFDGNLDEAKIYSRALSSDEIASYYQRQKNVFYPPVFSPSGSPQGFGKMFKGVTDTVATDGVISYSSEPSLSNLINLRNYVGLD